MSPGRRREAPGRSFQAAAAPYYGRSWRKRGYWRLPSSLRSGSTRARQERTFRSSRSWRRALRDELERELDGPPRTEVMRRLHETITARGLPREPFARLLEANRIDQAKTRYETWAEVREYCTYSADPVGRLVLGIYGQAGEPELVAMSDSVCTGLQLVNFLQDPPRY